MEALSKLLTQANYVMQNSPRWLALRDSVAKARKALAALAPPAEEKPGEWLNINRTPVLRGGRGKPETGGEVPDSPRESSESAGDGDEPPIGGLPTPESLGLDPGIARAVKTLRDAGVETFESCEGGEGHAFYEPTVRFGGGPEAGWRALAVCLAYGFPVRRLERYWAIQQGHEPTGPDWALVFWEQLP